MRPAASAASNTVWCSSDISRLEVAGGNVEHYASGNPSLAAATTTSGLVYQTVVAGNYAYIAESGGGLRIMDVSNPKRPATVGSYSGINTALSVAVAGTTFVTAPWQMVLTWGLLTGVGCGLVASVLAAQIVGRWFRARRGVALGLRTASVQTGQLIFVPLLAFVATNDGWRQASLIVAVAALVVIPIVVLLVPERPSAIGIAPYGATAIEATRAVGASVPSSYPCSAAPRAK